MDQLSFCDGLESLYTLVASGFAYADIAALPQVPLPGLRTIPLPELAPVSYGLSHRPGEASPALKPFLAQTRGMFQDERSNPTMVRLMSAPLQPVPLSHK